MSLAPSDQPPQPPQPPGRRSKPSLPYLMVVVLFLLVAGAAAVAMYGLRAGDESQTSTPAAATARSDTPSPVPSALATSAAQPAVGGLADPLLRRQVWDTITSYYRNMRGCAHVISSQILVTQRPDATGWQELWRISACGEPADLTIKFTTTSDGGIYYDIAE